jgi:hypothetical protein
LIKRQNPSIQKAWQDWKACLKGDDRNSIFNQITAMLWDTAIFRVVWESQKEKFNKNPQAPRINNQLYPFIYRNYFHAQSANIRRLTDPHSSLSGKYGTYSLGAIINNIKEYREELTREKYLGFRGFSYDYSKIQEKEMEFILNHPHEKTLLISEELDWYKIKEAHEAFDKLSQTNVNNRKPKDLINEHLLNHLQTKLADCREINLYVNKFIAHSATPESRAEINEEEYKITLKKIWDAHEIIFKIANFLSVVLFSTDNMPLAIEHPSFFEFWDEPFFDEKEAFDKVRKSFENYRVETETWMISSVKDVWSWIAG